MHRFQQKITRSSLIIISLICPVAPLVAAGQEEPDADERTTAEKILNAAAVEGGLVVHLGCGDGRLTAALRANSRYLVHGLDREAENVKQARDHVNSLGLYGPISIDLLSGEKLPYAEDSVNLVVASGECQVASEEIRRVLAPGGVALALDSRLSTLDSFRKPWPEAIDEWTHYLHGPDNNAVAQDNVVGPPRHFQWISPPRFSRSHDHLASVTAVVSSGGRLFSIVDMGSIAFAGASPRWQLVAQDAFNGIRLWQREIPEWEYHLRDFRSGPADIARRLVAVGDRVYVTLGYGQPVTELDAATGETIQTYAGTEGTCEIVYYNDTLLLVVGKPKREWRAQRAKQIVSQPGYSPPFERYTPPAYENQLMAVDARTGKLRWKHSGPDVRKLMPSTLAASGGRVYVQNADAVVGFDAATGQAVWKTPRPAHRPRLAWSTPTLVVHDGIVYSADRQAAETDGELLWIPSGGYHEYIRGEEVKGELIALDAATGQRLWSGPAYEGFNAPVDVLIADGLLWTGRYAWGQDPGFTEARDPKTGQVRRQRPADQEFLPRMGHARCHRAKATGRYLILGRRGIECVDMKTGNMVGNFWVRGNCQYGVMPANGLLYVPPHACACSVADMLKCGYMALAPGRSRDKGQESRDKSQESRDESVGASDGGRLERGPAYNDSGSGLLTLDSRLSTDWPTYRHDSARSGATTARVPHDLQVAWQTQLGGRLTSPVISDGVLLVAETDAHRVCALDATTGQQLWTFVAGARIDSPPTICKLVVPPSGGSVDRDDGSRLGGRPPEGGTTNGLCLFGSADGCVYCVRLADGELVWRFRAAPRDRRIVVNGQLESSWPVHGSVLVEGDAAYFVAGRTSYLDGGMLLYKLDVTSGRELAVQELVVEEKRRNGGFASGGHLPDVLSADSDSVFLRNARFDRELARQKDNVPHLWSSVGFLDDSWWHRTYWHFGTSMSSGWGGWAKAGQRVPAGRLLVTDGSWVFGYGRNQYDTPGAHVGVDADGVWGPIGRDFGRWTYYRLFGKQLGAKADKAARESGWTQRIPLLVQGMVLADQTVFVAGSTDPVSDVPHEPSAVDPLVESLSATQGGRLLAVSAVDGKTLAKVELTSAPVFDGMAATEGCLYLATKNGQVVCLGPAR